MSHFPICTIRSVQGLQHKYRFANNNDSDVIISTAYQWQCDLLWINKINSNISCAGSHWTCLPGGKYINGRHHSGDQFGNDSGNNDSDKQLGGAKYINGRLHSGDQLGNDSGNNDSDKQLGNKTKVWVPSSIWTWLWWWQYWYLSIHQDLHHALRHDVGTGERSGMPRVCPSLKIRATSHRLGVVSAYETWCT